MVNPGCGRLQAMALRSMFKRSNPPAEGAHGSLSLQTGYLASSQGDSGVSRWLFSPRRAVVMSARVRQVLAKTRHLQLKHVYVLLMTYKLHTLDSPRAESLADWPGLASLLWDLLGSK